MKSLSTSPHAKFESKHADIMRRLDELNAFRKAHFDSNSSNLDPAKQKTCMALTDRYACSIISTGFESMSDTGKTKYAKGLEKLVKARTLPFGPDEPHLNAWANLMLASAPRTKGQVRKGRGIIDFGDRYAKTVARIQKTAASYVALYDGNTLQVTCCRTARKAIEDYLNEEIVTSEKEAAEASQLVLSFVAACRGSSENDGEIGFSVREPSRSEIQRYLDEAHAAASADANYTPTTALSVEEYLKQGNVFLFIDESKSPKDGSKLIHTSLCQVSDKVYGLDEKDVLLEHVQTAIDIGRVNEPAFKLARNIVKREALTCFPSSPLEMPNVEANDHTKMVRTMVISLNAMNKLRDKNCVFEKKFTLHHLSLIQNGDSLNYLRASTSGTYYAYCWCWPRWPLLETDQNPWKPEIMPEP